jgi:Protein of unknown function (DUF4058)
MVLVNRAFCGDMRRSEIWPVALDEPLPLCPVPLLPPDADVPLSLGEVLAQVYQQAAYARWIDYALPVPPPPLRPAMQCWTDKQNKRHFEPPSRQPASQQLHRQPPRLLLPSASQSGWPRSAARHPTPGLAGSARPKSTCCRQGARPAAWRRVGAASSGLHNPEGAFPTGLWQNSV